MHIANLLHGEEQKKACVEVEMLALPDYADIFDLMVIKVVVRGTTVTTSEGGDFFREIIGSSRDIDIPCGTAVGEGTVKALVENRRMRDELGGTPYRGERRIRDFNASIGSRVINYRAAISRHHDH